MLTTTFSEWGAEQFVTYKNQDRHEEEVHEIVEGPCAISPLGASQLLETHASLLIGDCNAGKTTLLHALTDESQFLPFLHLQSLIPSVFGTFQNYRFCDVEAIRNKGLDPMVLCCDHADQKFLDTDISKVSISLTKADWKYLMDELGIEPRAIAADVTRFTLVEMGGDHLERLQIQVKDWESCTNETSGIDRTMSEQTISQTPLLHCHRNDEELFRNPKIDEICAHSRALLSNPRLKGVSYFINGRTAAGLDIAGEPGESIAAGPIQIQKFYVAQLRRRLKLLSTLCPHLQHLDVYVARLPPTVRTADALGANVANRAYLLPSPDPDAAMLDILSSVVGQDHVDRFELAYRRTATSELFKELAETVSKSCQELLPSYVVVNIHPFVLMESEPSMPPSVDVCAVYSFMRNSLISSLTGFGKEASDPEMLENLVTFFEGTRYQAAGDAHVALCNVWYTLTDLVEYEKANELSMPLPILLANFHRLMDELVAAKVCCVGVVPQTMPELWSQCFPETELEPLPLHKTLRITSGGNVILDWVVEADPSTERHYRFPIEEPQFQKAMAAIRAACRVKPDSVDWVLIRKEGIADVGPHMTTREELSMREVLMLSFDRQLAAGGGETHFSVLSKCGDVTVRGRGGLLDFSFKSV